MATRILLLADINSIHTQKWALGLAEDKIEIGIFSFNRASTDWYSHSPYIKCLSQSDKPQLNRFLAKLGYILYLPKLLYCIARFKPDIVHSHYASSYGLLGALTFFSPFMVSAWGSDVIEFPRKGILQRLTLKFVFSRASKICVTSGIMKNEVSKYSAKVPVVVPFGVDLNTFYHLNSRNKNSTFTFGCIKHFEKVYNIDKVVIAFGMLVRKFPSVPMKLKLIGDGSQKSDIQKLVTLFHLEEHVEFVGKIMHRDVPTYLNTFDAFLNVSEFESFGVAVAEAMACGVPVVVSNFEGFRDLVPGGENAIITRSTSPEDIFQAMKDCLLNADRRAIAAKKSYELIREKFNWKDNLRQMEQVYSEFMMPSAISHTEQVA
jgi:glycosyltransferase involved in cell wall biosynthesis